MSFSVLDSELLGPLFATEEMRAVFSDRALLRAMLRVEAALARAEAKLGLAPNELANVILAIPASELDPATLGAATAEAGVPTIPFVKAVHSKLPKHIEQHFHKGATTQDILDTARVLQIADAIGLVAGDLGVILEGLTTLANKHRTTPCVGRTYAQHAAPVTFGYKAAVWLAGIAEAADDLPRLRKRALAASLGGPVGTLTGLGDKGIAVLELFAADLGLAVPALSWHTMRRRIAETGVFLALLTGALAKMAADVAHLASTEVGELAEPHAPGRGGSSAMPHKRNPVSSTIILAAHGAAKGAVLPLFDAMAGQHERAMGLWHAEWAALPQLFGLASGALREARRLAEGLIIDAARMRANLDLTRGLIFADAVAARLAPPMGRDAAHRLVEAASAIVRESGQPLREALKASGSLTPELLGDIEAAFDLESAVEAAARFVDRAIAEAERVRSRLAQPDR